MLRFSLMPSDFHPLVLILGEGRDIQRLSDTLRAFARQPHDIELGRSEHLMSSDTRIQITQTPGPLGVHAVADDKYDLLWRLDADRASHFARLLTNLAAATRLAGSEHLDCGVEDEIPVQVSKGEFAEDFLQT